MKRFKNILAVCDEDSAYENALDRVSWLATSNDAKVTLVTTVETSHGDFGRLFSGLAGMGAQDIEDQVLDIRRQRLEEIAAPLRAQGLVVDTVVLQGTPFLAIIRQVLRADHDLVIKGAQRSPSGPFFRGPDMHLMRKCPCPVWVLNSAAESRARRILAAVDPDPTDGARDQLNRTVMQLATSLARQDGAKLDVVNVWRLQEESTLRHSLAKVPAADVDKLVAKEESRSSTRLYALVEAFMEFDDLMRVLHIKGIAADVIPEHVAAEGIDTVVMGSLARTGVAGFFIGNTAETILNRVTCSVLTVKAPGFVSPVEIEGDAAGAGD